MQLAEFLTQFSDFGAKRVEYFGDIFIAVAAACVMSVGTTLRQSFAKSFLERLDFLVDSRSLFIPACLSKILGSLP